MFLVHEEEEEVEVVASGVGGPVLFIDSEKRGYAGGVDESVVDGGVQLDREVELFLGDGLGGHRPVTLLLGDEGHLQVVDRRLQVGRGPEVEGICQRVAAQGREQQQEQTQDTAHDYR